MPWLAPVETPFKVMVPVPEVLKAVPVKSIQIPTPEVDAVELPRPKIDIFPPAAFNELHNKTAIRSARTPPSLA